MSHLFFLNSTLMKAESSIVPIHLVLKHTVINMMVENGIVKSSLLLLVPAHHQKAIVIV